MQILRPPQTTVGASLLAIAVGQPHYLLTDTTPSRASPLPQGVTSTQAVLQQHLGPPLPP
ncbi:hypothetical protein DZG01_21360 [Pseudomonas fluorescens]|nr:hypothetical protein DZG01_21360 [Pseudomonas fluorescens]